MEKPDMKQCLHDWWRLSLVIESAVRRADGKDSETHREVMAAILQTQEFYKSAPRSHQDGSN